MLQIRDELAHEIQTLKTGGSHRDVLIRRAEGYVGRRVRPYEPPVFNAIVHALILQAQVDLVCSSPSVLQRGIDSQQISFDRSHVFSCESPKMAREESISLPRNGRDPDPHGALAPAAL